VASYSVSTQGSPLQERAPLLEEQTTVEDAALPKDEPVVVERRGVEDFAPLKDEPFAVPAPVEESPVSEAEAQREFLDATTESPSEPQARYFATKIVGDKEFFGSVVDAPIPAILAPRQQQTEEPVPTLEAEREEVAADLLVEEVQTSFEAPASTNDDAPTEEASAAEDVAVPAGQVQVEDSISTQVLEASESVLATTEEVTEAVHVKDIQAEKEAPQVPELVLDTSEEVTEVSNPHMYRPPPD
jgi:hypothetical protein